MEITNKTKKPLSVPLPAGKKLFLGPGKSGQITQKAAERPAVVAMVEAGDVEISSEEATKRQGGGHAGGSAPSATRHGGTGAMRQSGDK